MRQSLPSLAAQAALQTSSLSPVIFNLPNHTALLWKIIPKCPAEQQPNSPSPPVPPPANSGPGGERAATGPSFIILAAK